MEMVFDGRVLLDASFWRTEDELRRRMVLRRRLLVPRRRLLLVARHATTRLTHESPPNFIKLKCRYVHVCICMQI